MTIETTTKTAKVRTPRPTKTPEEMEAIKAAAAEKRAAALAAAAATSWTSGINAKFVGDIAKGAHHRGKFTVSAKDGGYEIKATDDGLRFFRNRNVSNVGRANAAVAAASIMLANKSGKFLFREWQANAARIGGKMVAMPHFAQSGDFTQQACFSMLIGNYIAAAGDK